MSKNSTKKNFIYNSIYQILLILLPLITTPYVSRILGPELIGKFSYSYSIAVIFGVFSLLGLNNYGNRTIATKRNNKEELSKSFLSIYSMQIVSSLTTIIVYILFTIFTDGGTISWAMLIYVASTGLDVNWFLSGLEEFKLIAIRSIAVKTIMTLSIFLLVKDKNDLLLYSIIVCLSALLTQISVWPYVIKRIEKTHITKKDILSHIKPNLLLFIPVIAISIYHYMDKVMLGAMSSEAEVGYYESVDKIMNVPMALINSLGTVMLPKMANMLSIGKEKEAKKYIEKSMAFAMLFSTALSFGIMGVSKTFVPFYYGEGFEKCIQLFYIIMPSCLFLAFANVIRTQYLIPRKKDGIYVKSVILGAVVNLIINTLLIPAFSSVGAAIGTLLAQIAVCVYQAIKSKTDLPIMHYVTRSTPYITSGLIMLIIIVVLFNQITINNPVLSLLLQTMVGGTIYIITLLLSKIFKFELLSKDILNRYLKKASMDS